jgi:hypothetical protein
MADNPQFNQRNVQKYLDDLSTMEYEQQQIILDEIEKQGLLSYLYSNFTVDRNFVKAIEASPNVIINQLQATIMNGIPASAKFIVSMPDMFIGDNKSENGEKSKRRKTTITITIEPVKDESDGKASEEEAGLVGVINWNLFGGGK